MKFYNFSWIAGVFYERDFKEDRTGCTPGKALSLIAPRSVQLTGHFFVGDLLTAF